jgi:LPS-assembly protein
VFALMSLAVLTTTPAGDSSFTLGAERVLHDALQQRTTAEGGAWLQGNTMAINADRVTYDAKAQTVTAVGHVVGRLSSAGLVGFTGDVVSLRFVDDEVAEVSLHQAQAVLYAPGMATAFLAATTPKAMKAVSKPTVLLSGNHLRREGSVWRVSELTLVPCDCDVSQPSWSMRANEALIDEKAQRASLIGTSIHLGAFRLPLPPIPWVSVPLSERQSGLLFPKLTPGGPSGFGFELPVFITLGRSADVTLTPGYFTGGFSSGRPTVLGLQGPRLGAECRYAPSRNTDGRVSLGLVYDVRPQRDAVNPALNSDQPRGLRGEVAWQHRSDLPHGFGVRVDGQAHSDGYYLRDGVVDVVAREDGALRSSATLFHRGDNHVVSVDVALRQDVQWGYDLFGRTPMLPQSVAPARAPSTLQRLPAVQLAVPLTPLVGPLWGDFSVSAVRHSPLGSLTGDEGQAANEGRDVVAGEELRPECLRERLYLPNTELTTSCGVTAADKIGMADGQWQAGEREARDRLDVRPRLGLSGVLGQVAQGSVSLAWRQQAWVGEASGQAGYRGYALASARLATEVRGDWSSAWVHRVLPSVEMRAVPFVWGQEPAPYDELDRALVGLGARVQAVAEVSQRLKYQGAEVARLDIGQGVSVVGPQGARLAETFARANVSTGLLSAGAQVRFDPTLGRLTRLSASAAASLGQVQLFGGYENLLDDGSNRTRQPIDLLFADGISPTAISRAQLLNFGARTTFGPVSLAYEALFLSQRWAQQVSPLTFSQHRLTVGISPMCDCWRVDVSASQVFQVDQPAQRLVLLPGAPVNLGFGFSISRFGTFGSGR